MFIAYGVQRPETLFIDPLLCSDAISIDFSLIFPFITPQHIAAKNETFGLTLCFHRGWQVLVMGKEGR